MTDAALAALAAASYVDAPTWQKGDVQVCATERDGVVFVAFRGTSEPLDWLRDCDARPLRDPFLGWCHAGFLMGVESVAAAIVADLAGKRVVLTGHSLGGALALLFAGKLLEAGRPPELVVTFGAPRVGFSACRLKLAAVPALRLYRNGNDPIPGMPWGFKHPAELIPIGERAFKPFDCHAVARYVAAMAELPSLTQLGESLAAPVGPRT